MKNLLAVINKMFPQPTTKPVDVSDVCCPDCGALLFTSQDLEAFENVGVCEDCYIRISNEALEGCEEYHDEDDDDYRASCEIYAYQQGIE